MQMRKRIVVLCSILFTIALGILLYSQLHSDIKLNKSSKGIKINYTNKFHRNANYNLVEINENDIWNNEQYIIVKGTVKTIRNIKIKFGSEKSYGAIVTIEPNKIFRGNIDNSDISIFVNCCIGGTLKYEDSDTLSILDEGDQGIFIIRKNESTDTWEENGKILYMNEIADYCFDDAARFAFVEKNGKVVFDPMYKNISRNATITNIEEYIENRIK